jgi:hypothetical protein
MAIAMLHAATTTSDKRPPLCLCSGPPARSEARLNLAIIFGVLNLAVFSLTTATSASASRPLGDGVGDCRFFHVPAVQVILLGPLSLQTAIIKTKTRTCSAQIHSQIECPALQHPTERWRLVAGTPRTQSSEPPSFSRAAMVHVWSMPPWPCRFTPVVRWVATPWLRGVGVGRIQKNGQECDMQQKTSHYITKTTSTGVVKKGNFAAR